jgi:hypothetical protein
VKALRHLDRAGADVLPGTVGEVVENANAHGPIVRWPADRFCNVYEGDVEVC